MKKLKNKRRILLKIILHVQIFLIKNKYTHKGGFCFYGGSAGGLTGGAVINMRPDLFFSALLLVPFVDTLTTMLNEKLPLTPAEWELWGNPIKDKDFLNILSLILLTIISKVLITQIC